MGRWVACTLILICVAFPAAYFGFSLLEPDDGPLDALLFSLSIAFPSRLTDSVAVAWGPMLVLGEALAVTFMLGVLLTLLSNRVTQ